MKFTGLVQLFLSSHERNQSARNTIVFYRTQLRQLAVQLGAKVIDQIGPGDVLHALEASCAKRGSNSTRRARAIAVQQLQQFAVDNSLIVRPWLAKIPKPTGGHRTRIPTEEETKAILRGGSAAFRLIYEALRLSGARPNELCRATIADWDRPQGVILLREHKTARKSGKPRLIPVGKKLERLLQLAAGKRKEGPLFLTNRRTAWTVGNLSTQFTRIKKQAGISDELVLYSARHEAGTRFCKTHGILVASRLLGHSNITMTQRYVHTDVEALRAAQDGTAIG